MSSKRSRPKSVLVARGCIYRGNGDQLILKRSPKDRHNPSQWEYPGGKIEEGETIDEALKKKLLRNRVLL